MAKGLYFYKLVSPYREDVTKDCKLTINEIDSNFISLKDVDIKDFTYDKDTKQLILTRNGIEEEKLVADLSQLVDGIVHDLDVVYEEEIGRLTISYNGEKTVIDGILTKKTLESQVLTHVNTDTTLKGLGTFKRPLGLKVTEQTGQYKPVKRFIDIVNGEKLPCGKHIGERYVTREKVSDYGFLYDFKSVHEIAKDLKNGWRVPSKEDWDNMLNAIEPCERDRNHHITNCNIELGRFAGKLLKSSTRWTDCNCETEVEKCSCGCLDKDEEFDVVDVKHEHFHHFKHPYHLDGCCDNDKECHPYHKPENPMGVDSFGMRILPAGYGDGCSFFGYFGLRGAYWTSTLTSNQDVYVKRFYTNKSGVVQVAETPRGLFSLRLVKDYDGSNFNEVEFINGQMYSCVLVPSLHSKSGFAIWTSVNIAFDDSKYSPKPVPGDIEKYFNIRYFTAEWDGHSWVKKVMHEGDSVVLFIGLKGEEYTEYRLIQGELISVNSKIFEDVRKELENYIKEIEDAIEEEKAERENTDNILSGSIETLEDRVVILEDRLISGGTYDNSTGILTLNTKDNGNDIEIQFNGNYGEF